MRRPGPAFLMVRNRLRRLASILKNVWFCGRWFGEAGAFNLWVEDERGAVLLLSSRERDDMASGRGLREAPATTPVLCTNTQEKYARAVSVNVKGN